MIWLVLGLGVGFLAATASGWSLVVAYRALRNGPSVSEDLLRAFKRLESDFEELSDRVASQLGRISRLKRDTLQGTNANAGAAAPGHAEEGKAAAPVPSPMSRSRLLALAKKKGGLTYAEESDSTGTNGG